MTNILEATIGEHMGESTGEDWLGYWPIVDNDGIITGLVEADNVPSNATMVDLVGGELVQTEGGHGFDAVILK